MKQPQLGKKISELRLAKGLTQTELAEQCNISLRTIQRIEAADVTPRSFTLKLIFKNLDYDGYNLTNDDLPKKDKSVFDFKKDRIIKISVLLVMLSIAVFGFFKLYTNNKTPSTSEVFAIIKNSQANIKRWINNKQVDSVLTQFSDNACILNSICGKVQIRQMINNNIDKDYKILDYNTIAISVSDSIAVEKYESVYVYKGNSHKQIGVMEWQLINRKWLIVNDMFRDY